MSKTKLNKNTPDPSTMVDTVTLNKVIKARDVLKMTPQQILKSFPKTVDVIYDDGIKVTSTSRKLVYSWFIWEFHRRYSILPLHHEHHVDSVLNGQLLSSNTHIDMFTRICKQLILVHNLSSHAEKEYILEIIYYITNQLHNELPKLAGRYVMTLDILDILELSQDERVLEMKEKMESKTDSIEKFYNSAHKVILDDPKYRSNNLVQFIRMKILNINQVNQCILARGFPIEVTGTILSTPILSNYAKGMYKLYDYVAESRGAAKHLYAAEAPLQQAEYFARRLQLAGMVVTGVSDTDCGTTNYLTWFVKPPSANYSGDLRFLKGKIYLDGVTNKLKDITGKEHHLVGKFIKLRSVIYCQEKDPHKVCPVCFGLLHHNVSRFANLGHLCDANLTQQLTQTLLSTKHHISSAIGSEILLKEDAQRYLRFFYPTMSFYLKPFNKTSKYKMIVRRETALGITDLKLLKNIDTVNVKRISQLSEIIIQETLANGSVAEIQVKIEQNKRYGYLSYEFLKFIKDVGWTTNEYDFFVFDLTNWDIKQPLIRVPDMEYSYSDHVDQIAGLIESKDKKIYGRIKPDTPEELLQELFDLVNSKISANIALLEVMVYAVMTPGVNDYGMARNVPAPIVNIARNIISNRSLGPAYAYEGQAEIISNPRSFFQQNRPDSPVDTFVAPKQVVSSMYSDRKLYIPSK